jgi:NTE family protein
MNRLISNSVANKNDSQLRSVMEIQKLASRSWTACVTQSSTSCIGQTRIWRTAMALLLACVATVGCQSAPKASVGQTVPAGNGTAPVAAMPTTPSPPVPQAPKVAPSLGLALGGGAARGFAHIGVIQVLEENGIYPQMVAGTSAGSLVAAMYAAGNNGAALVRLAREMDESSITDWTFPLRGVIRGEALANYVRKQTAGKLIEQLAMPLGIVATDLASGEAVLFRRGDIGTAVRASSAVPSVFQPVKIGTREFVDGGLASPVPVLYAREMGAQVVIAVDISSPPSGNAPQDALSMLLQTFAIMGKSINTWELKTADLVIRPDLSAVKGSDFSARMVAVEAGRKAALAALPAIKRLLTPR